MDASSFNTKRRYPSYTLAQLESFVAEGVTNIRDAAKIADIAVEIAARKSGASVYSPTPQVAGGAAKFSIGRM